MRALTARILRESANYARFDRVECRVRPPPGTSSIPSVASSIGTLEAWRARRPSDQLPTLPFLCGMTVTELQ